MFDNRKYFDSVPYLFYATMQFQTNQGRIDNANRKNLKALLLVVGSGLLRCAGMDFTGSRRLRN
jgi:hypothetical protein